MVLPLRTEDFGSCSQDWLRENPNAMDMSAEKNFTNQPEGTKEFHLLKGKYLNDAMSLICSKVNALVPVLEDSRLLNYLIDSYNRHLFATLDLLMDRSSSMIEAFFLLNWVKQTYFSQDLKGCHIIQDGVLRVSDPLLLTDWFEKSKQKVLILVQEHISTTLQNILQYEAQSVCEYTDEEALIKVQLDVIQVLEKDRVKVYVNAENEWLKLQKPNEKNSLHFFRTIYTCQQLRSYALTIVDFNNNTDSFTILMLENMESQVLSSISQSLKTLAELIVNAAYQSVTRAYLQCLMQRKYRQLDRKWDDIEKRVKQDLVFSTTLSPSWQEMQILIYILLR
ncbi:hypothetical protein P4O66_013610 [Electrophorus voltai]|uniref:Uncharacterized protein n=1 Tax=Electrophorus voltai TaxID=2609070 RepID=A0AAD8Z554_9TELE|nr:hypothetical protein P4O66_013610 [Electrophorus voltai]